MPRVPTNQRMNTNLKTIAKLLEWDEIKYIPEYDNFGKLVQVNEIALKDLFSTKFMRKTSFVRSMSAWLSSKILIN